LYDTPFLGFGEVKASGRTIRWKVYLPGEMWLEKYFFSEGFVVYEGN
jgi:hypothetical protein